MSTFKQVRTIKQVPDDEQARRLADEMLVAGEWALIVEVERSTTKSVRFLERFSFLRSLTIGGKARHVEVIGVLPQLTELCLLRVATDHLRFLGEVRTLKHFDMRFGGCNAFDTLASATELISLKLTHLPSLKNLNSVQSMPNLQLLEVSECKGITELADFSQNIKLRKLVLETMNGLTSLASVETAKKLEYLVIMEARALPPTEFARVKECPSLRKVLAGIALMTSARYREALACIPSSQQMDGYYGTPFQNFEYDDYSDAQ